MTEFEKTEGVSRRAFLSGAAAFGGILAAGALSGCAPTATNASTDEAPLADTGETAEEAKNVAETIDCDIVVLGAGWSGLAAAVEAMESNVNVVVLERAATYGGTGIFTEGMFGSGSSLQKAAGVPDYDVRDMIAEEQEYAHYFTNYWQYEEFFGTSGENVDWMVNHGVEFGEIDNYQGMGKFDCFHWWKERNGQQAMDCLAKALEDGGIDVRYKTSATELIIEDGAVKGVYAQEDDSKDYLQVNAKAVIICTGGAAGDLELIAEKMGIDTTFSASTTGQDSTGDGYRMAMQAGAGTRSMCVLQNSYVYGAGEALNGCATRHCLLAVNNKGRRFMREDLQQEIDLNIATNCIRTQGAVHTIFDSSMVDLFEKGSGVYVDYMFGPGIGANLEGLQDEIDGAIADNAGSVFKADTIEDLASQMGLDPAVLAETVSNYNGYCEAGKDDEFGTDPTYLKPVATPPFYAARIDFQIIKSIGGYKLNEDMQLVSATQQVIPGLYGAGMDGCAIFGDTYNIAVCGGNSGYCCYSGRKAVQSAIKEL